MAGERSVHVGRDAIATVITPGDNNKVSADASDSRKTKMPLPADVDIAAELALIRGILEHSGRVGKISRALDDAMEEVGKPKPDKDEVGSALGRALNYVKETSSLVDDVAKLAPHVTNAVAWLGENWHHLLPLVGLTA